MYFIVQDWTYDDVSEWMANISLQDYIETFKNNHISGKNLLDLSEKELKDDLGMFSVGHRKNFLKSQEHLQKIYSKNKIFNQAIRMKLKKFYEKHKNHLRSNINLTSRHTPSSYGFNSFRNSIHSEIIEEDQNDQLSVKKDIIKPSSEITNKKPSIEITNKKMSYDNYADDENEENSPKKETALKKMKSKKISESPALYHENKGEISTKISNNTEQENNNHDNGNHNNNNNKSESESSSEFSSSSDEEQVNGNKKIKEKPKLSIEIKSNKFIHTHKQPDKAKKLQQYSSSLDSNILIILFFSFFISLSL